MRLAWILLLAVSSASSAQDMSDGCGAALDALNRLKETFFANPERLNPKLAHSNLITATRNCPDSGELWYFRATLGRMGGASEGEIAYASKRARDAGWNRDAVLPAKSAPAVLPSKLGTKWALIVGVGKFLDPKLQARPLTYPPADAQALRDLLVHPEIGRFPASQVHLLTNENAKVAQIREEIGWLRQNAQPNDLVVVYFASHGLSRSQDPNRVSYIAAYDSSLENPAKRYATSIQMIDLVVDLTRELQALRIVLILDTCYSGDAAAGATENAVATSSVSQTASFSEALKLFQTGAGRVVLTAASADQLSYESAKLKHGYFTYFLLKALQETSGKITVGDLYSRARDSTETAVRSDMAKTQTPLMIAGSAASGIVLGAEAGN